MKKREGFTLMELLVAAIIFSFVVAALATISATAHRHMFQSYRSNQVKTGVLLGMRAIQKNLSVATRIDFPAAAAQGDVLAFAVNVDQNTGCFPISAANQASWHYFCMANGTLYHHTAQFGGNSNPGCTTMGFPLNPFTIASYPNFCGPGGGGTVTLMTQNVSPATTLFSRRGFDGINEVDTVMIRLRSFWSAAGRGVGASSRDVDFSLDTVIKVNRPQ